jgi:putative peptidoglycan lipid II flippase
VTDAVTAGGGSTPGASAAPVGRDTSRSSVLVGAGILLSRVGGLIRSIVLAATLGTSPAADAFRAALRIPQLLQNLLGEGALSAAFIPVYSSLLEQGKQREADRAAGAVAGLIAACTAALVLAGTLLARPLTSLLAPGFTGATYELTVTLTRLMTAGLGFVVLAAWCLGVLNAHRKFFLSYAAPLLWNAAQIVALGLAVLADEPDSGIAEYAAWGVLIGGVAQFAVQLPSVHKVAPHIRLSLDTHVEGVRDVLRRFGPAVLGRGVVQLGAYLDLVLASLLVVGSVTVLDLAQILFLLPISLFAIAIAAAELPELSRTTDSAGLLDRLTTADRRVAFFMVGATVAFVVGGGTLAAAIYGWGNFDSTDTLLVWLVVATYSIGLVPTGAARLLQNGLFARGDTAGPAAIAVVRMLVASAIGLCLMFQLEQIALVPAEAVTTIAELGGSTEQVGDLPAALRPLPAETRSDEDAPARLGVLGLAVGSAVASWLEWGLLHRRLRRRVGAAPPLHRTVGALLVPAGCASIAIVAVQLLVASAPILVQAAAVAVAGAVGYLGACAATGVPEVTTMLDRAKRGRRGGLG